MSEEQNKLNIINKILDNEQNFQEYIETIDKQNVCIPNKLNENIMKNIKVFNSIKENNNKKYNFTDILKVACFAFVTVLSWELVVSKINNIDYSKLQKQTEIVSFSNKDNTLTNKLGEFMMSEIIKGGEK